MEDGNFYRYLPLLKASLNGDWITANRYFQEDPALVTSYLSSKKETALHAAISTGCSCDDFIRKLVEIMPVDSLALPNVYGHNALHYAAIVGHTDAAMVLIEKNPSLTLARDDDDCTPVLVASESAHKKTVKYLISVTPDGHPSPFDGTDGVRLLTSLILCEYYGFAIDLVKRKPMLATGKNRWGSTALDILALKPKTFSDGSAFGRFKQVIVQYLFETQAESNGNEFGFLQDMHNTITMKRQAKELLRLLISEAYKANPSIANSIQANATIAAAKFGTHEFVRESIKSNADTVYCVDTLQRTIFHIAILYRHENIFNLLHEMGVFSTLITFTFDKLGNNMLHLAGKLAPSNKISGAALQMQRELQWFKEVEKIVQPLFRELNNKEGKTPRMVFTEEHNDLLEKGEKWMKDTASSCATVAALSVTVMFAATFTAPGGNNSEKGIPILLNQTTFLIFMISDALGLITSSTSLLMFLGILTSRCAEEDFLRALPMRMSIGLITLFFSIVSMLVAFCAAFYLVMFERVAWIAVPIGLVASVPVLLFAILQFRLLVEITYSTFGPSIFGKQHQKFIFWKNSDDLSCFMLWFLEHAF
ncbi:Ankyrin repeat family protein [Euphorbia peplus]|nr:Ankyrin repeat family protein [Euphorbia peplus]